MFFCNSGTEAWEGALKLARVYAHVQNANGHNPKWRLIALDNSFHGRTFGALATTGQPKYRAPFAPLVPGVSFVKLNDLDGLKRRFDSSVCAICVETIQGEGGIRPVSPAFLELARKLTTQPELFFERPSDLAREQPAVHACLVRYFGIDLASRGTTPYR